MHGPSRRRFLALGAAGIACLTQGTSGFGCNRDDQKRDAEGSTADDGSVDLVVWGGTIITMNAFKPKAEAVAVRGDKVVEVGTRALIERSVGKRTTIVDLAGGVATPGLTDSHAHLSRLGRHLEEVDLHGARSTEEVVQRLRGDPGHRPWILASGWDESLWIPPEMPTHQPLTQAFSDRPVRLERVDGRAVWGNEALLRQASITAETPDPEGGAILRDEEGNPTGVLVDAAVDLVPEPAPTHDDRLRWILSAQQHLIPCGVTGVHEMGIGPDEDGIYRELASATDPEKRLLIRVHAYANEDWFARELRKRAPDTPGDSDLYALGGLMLVADGELDDYSAALITPYSDRPDQRGRLRYGQRQLDRLCTNAMGAGWQVATHAVGDAASRAVLRAYDKALQRYGRTDLLFRVECLQILAPSDVPTLATLGVMASMQPIQATREMHWLESRIGKRRVVGAHAWRTLLNSGVRICFGSDAPRGNADIMHGLHAAVTRQDKTGQPEGGWRPEQKLELHEALRAYSAEAARAARRDAHLGVLREGYQADLTCFDQDITSISPQELRVAKILATVVRGEVVYRA